MRVVLVLEEELAEDALPGVTLASEAALVDLIADLEEINE